MSNDKEFIWEGTRYELEPVNTLPPIAMFSDSTPYIRFNGQFFLGKAMPNEKSKQLSNSKNRNYKIENYEFIKYPETKAVDRKDTRIPHKVTRLSDNISFVKGEKVISTWGEQIITGFLINEDDEMVIEFETCRNPLSKIEKVKPIPLFTTSDSVLIYENGGYWYVDDRWNISHYFATEGGIYGDSYEKRTYSTEKKAKEYVSLHKPMNICIKDLKDIIDRNWDSNNFTYASFYNKILEAHNQKINDTNTL